MSPIRCEWVVGSDPASVAYHDDEWGVPEHDDRRLFELLTLEGAQAGLSWSTILHKREGYRKAFAGFNPEVVAAFTSRDVERLLQDSGIVRNRLKVESTVANARCVLDVRSELGTSTPTCGGSSTAHRWCRVGDRSGRSRPRRRSPGS